MVEVLGHIGEGFVAELTLVKWLCSVGLPVGKRKKKTKSYHLSLRYPAAVKSPCFSPVHDKSHLSSEAVTTVHTEVPGYTRVCAQVCLQRYGLLENPATLLTFMRSLLMHTFVSSKTVD